MVPKIARSIRILCPPQAARPPNAAINSRRPSIDRQLRRRAGIPRKTWNASTAPASGQARLLLPTLGHASRMLLTAVVVTVMAVVPVVVPPPRVTLLPVQVGRSGASSGDEVGAQARVMVPEKPPQNATLPVSINPGRLERRRCGGGRLRVFLSALAVTICRNESPLRRRCEGCSGGY